MAQEEFINLREFEDARKYWTEKLSGELAEVKLPGDFPAVSRYAAANYQKTLDNHLLEKLLQISKNNNLSLYIILLTAFKILLFKYLDLEDIIVASPIYSESSQEYNKYILLRDVIHPHLTFKELLITVKNTVLEGYQNEYYDHKNLFKSPIQDAQGQDRPGISLARMVFLMENIHKKELTEDIRDDYEIDLLVSFHRDESSLEMEVTYNRAAFKPETIQRFCGYYFHILAQVLENTGTAISHIRLITEAERNKILQEFNQSESPYTVDKTIIELFEQQVEKTPHHIAVSAPLDMSELFEALESDTTNLSPHLIDQLKKYCFRKTPYIYEHDIEVSGQSGSYKILKVHQHNSVIVNPNVLKLLDCFNGEINLYSIFSGIKDLNLEFLFFSLGAADILEVVSQFKKKEEILVKGRLEDFVRVVKSLYENHLIEVAKVNSNELELENSVGDYSEEKISLKDKYILNKIFDTKESLSRASVLLLGDTPGMPTTGLLYLASYLKRSGIDAYCQFYDINVDYESLRKNLEGLLKTIQPKVVGISLKWFSYIARVLEMCKIVKEYAAVHCSIDIKVVLGGNTASYYCRDIIGSEYVDYVVQGDGEIPLLKICQDADDLPNCVYKKNDEIVVNPITYVQNETNSQEIYLSHLEEILLSRYSSILGTFFIFTHKGCPMDCLYCGGCRQAQQKVFNRVVYHRDVELVQKDILEAQKYTSTFMFDFVSTNNDKVLDYCHNIWKDIDLSSHFCIFVNVIPPSPRLIQLVNKTFKYVYWELDIAGLSQRHRKHLESLGIVKLQPSDNEILNFFSDCERYNNNEVRINLISGLPYVEQKDMVEGEKLVSRILSTYSCFSDLHWGRLHAQPGAPIVENPEKYDMYSYASTYKDFLEISKKNFKSHSQLDFSNIEYPYIYFKDEKLNSQVSKHYIETNLNVDRYRKNKRKKSLIAEDSSYQQINHSANRVAEVLREKALQTNDIAALIMTTSVDMVVGILGVLKTGSAYLPIDPEYPHARIKYMLADSKAKVLLSNRGIETETGMDCKVVNINLIGNRSDTLPPPLLTSSFPGSKNLVYIIYTSGTAGKPRGVLIEHKGLMNYTLWRLENYHYVENDVTLQPLSYSFDGFCSNFYSSLLSGGRLVLIPDSRRRDPEFIIELIKYYQVTNTSLVPGLFHILLDQADAPDLRSLRFIVLAGEKSSESLIKWSKEKASHVLLINEYGPTEATVTAAARLNVDELNTFIMGKPIANTRIYILNSYLELTPVGVIGELCVSGPGVARGYLNNPELTENKFIRAVNSHFSLVSGSPSKLSTNDQCPMTNDHSSQSPNTPLPHSPIYRTGDLARWLSDGSIEFCGRIDFQVKIRGFRIEPGEVESQLLKHHDVKEVVVITSEEKNNQKEDQWLLIAYIIASPGKKLDLSGLKKYLSTRLPDYMMPSHFIRIEKIPLTPNGKINRKALAQIKFDTKSEYTIPETELEKIIADTWKEILDLDKISVNTPFFDLGGNSLKLITVNNKLKKKLGIDIPIMAAFEYTTVRSLATYLQSEETGIGQDEIEIRQIDEKRDGSLNMMEQTLQIIDRGN